MALKDGDAMLLFVNGRLPPTAALLCTVGDAQWHVYGLLYCEVLGFDWPA
jgi:hypothetical protein